MLNFFKGKKHNKQPSNPIQMMDLEGKPLKVGDIVESLRYEMGKCKIVEGEKGLEYESIETGKKVRWVKMIDAATSFQKVRKIC